MKGWEDIFSENQKLIAKQDAEASGGGGGGGGGMASMLGGGGGGTPEGMGVDATGGMSKYSKLMGGSLMGSGKFTAAEIKRGYRRLGKA